MRSGTAGFVAEDGIQPVDAVAGVEAGFVGRKIGRSPYLLMIQLDVKSVEESRNEYLPGEYCKSV